MSHTMHRWFDMYSSFRGSKYLRGFIFKLSQVRADLWRGTLVKAPLSLTHATDGRSSISLESHRTLLRAGSAQFHP